MEGKLPIPDRICVTKSSQMYYPKQMNVNTAGTLNDMVNKEGTTSTGFPATPLCIAAINEHLPVCKLLNMVLILDIQLRLD